MGGGGNQKKIHAREHVRKKFMQGKMSEKKSQEQDGPHFDMNHNSFCQSAQVVSPLYV